MSEGRVSSRFRSLSQRLAAELSVVVLGVWIALWADGWTAARNDREIEMARLGALAQNMERTLRAVREQQANAEGAVTALHRLVFPSESMQEPDSLKQALMYGFFYVPGLSPELNVYEDLKNSGELALLTNTALRQALSSMEASLEDLETAQQDMATVQQLNYDPYLLSRIDLRPILGAYLNLPESGPTQAQDFRFVTTREFRNLVLFKLDLTVQVQSALNDVQEDLSRVSRLIADQLGGRREDAAGS